MCIRDRQRTTQPRGETRRAEHGDHRQRTKSAPLDEVPGRRSGSCLRRPGRPDGRRREFRRIDRRLWAPASSPDRLLGPPWLLTGDDMYMKNSRIFSHVVGRRSRAVMVLGAATLALAGCKGMLDVDNPNNVSSGALQDPTAAPAIVNGAINTGANALSSLLNAYTIISDETFQSGSRDDYRLLDTGEIDINTNEYLQASYLVAMRARWMAEQAIKQVGQFDADGLLQDKQLLAQAYLMGAIIYDEMGNMFDDVAISDRINAGPNLGEQNMVQVYDSALKWLDAGVAIAAGENKAAGLGMRARVRFDQAVWQKLNPPGTTPADPLVNDAQAT